jgi:hypothetical protein
MIETGLIVCSTGMLECLAVIETRRQDKLALFVRHEGFENLVLCAQHLLVSSPRNDKVQPMKSSLLLRVLCLESMGSHEL